MKKKNVLIALAAGSVVIVGSAFLWKKIRKSIRKDENVFQSNFFYDENGINEEAVSSYVNQIIFKYELLEKYGLGHEQTIFSYLMALICYILQRSPAKRTNEEVARFLEYCDVPDLAEHDGYNAIHSLFDYEMTLDHEDALWCEYWIAYYASIEDFETVYGRYPFSLNEMEEELGSILLKIVG